MDIPIRHSQSVTILDPQGKITIGAGDIALRQAVESALEAGSRRILINMVDVLLIDSAGIGELISVHMTVRNRGGQLKLARLPRRVQRNLQVARLVDVLEIFDEEAEALASFSREAVPAGVSGA